MGLKNSKHYIIQAAAWKYNFMIFTYIEVPTAVLSNSFATDENKNEFL